MAIQATHAGQSLLFKLDTYTTLSGKTAYIHDIVRQCCPNIDRIAIAKYDPGCDTLRTHVHSMPTSTSNPLTLYQAKLHEVPSLQQLVDRRTSRVINDLSVFDDYDTPHSRRILESGFRSSYTVPMFNEQGFIGMLFFNSYQQDTFAEENLSYLNIIARLLSMLFNAELAQFNVLKGALKTATAFSHHRDPETGAHLERMARFSHLIARELAQQYGLNDEEVEDIFLFSPLHDIGKIAIPDHILLKPGKLTAEEFDLMKTHTTQGAEIITRMLENFQFHNLKNLQKLTNIILYHHENIDGSGYPQGICGDAIPIEARIVATADVFDALTSKRPYKDAWSNEAAVAELTHMATYKLDKDCVAALCNNLNEVTFIQSSFNDPS